MMEPDKVKSLIETGLAGSEVVVTGDGRHFQALVVNDAFAGMSMLQQHRMVYAALGDSFETDAVHALALKTFTRDEWRSDQEHRAD